MKKQKTMLYEALLTPQISLAINNDEEYQALIKKRIDLKKIAIPKIIKTHEGIYQQRYNDEFYELLHKINELIIYRQQTIYDWFMDV